MKYIFDTYWESLGLWLLEVPLQHDYMQWNKNYVIKCLIKPFKFCSRCWTSFSLCKMIGKLHDPVVTYMHKLLFWCSSSQCACGLICFVCNLLFVKLMCLYTSPKEEYWNSTASCTYSLSQLNLRSCVSMTVENLHTQNICGSNSLISQL